MKSKLILEKEKAKFIPVKKKEREQIRMHKTQLERNGEKGNNGRPWGKIEWD